jgi:hypothetical protein
MRDLLACLSHRELTIGDKSYWVRPPSLEEALRVLDAIEAVRENEDEAWSMLRDVCLGWLPHEVCVLYFGNNAVPFATVSDIQELLAAGVQNRERHKKDAAAVEEEAQTRSWFAVIADYSDALNTPALEVLKTPFPFFIALCAEALRLQERRKADVTIGYVIAKSGGDLFQDLMKAAGYTSEADLEDWTPDPEWEAQQLEKAKRYAQTGGKMGEA